MYCLPKSGDCNLTGVGRENVVECSLCHNEYLAPAPVGPRLVLAGDVTLHTEQHCSALLGGGAVGVAWGIHRKMGAVDI